MQSEGPSLISADHYPRVAFPTKQFAQERANETERGRVKTTNASRTPYVHRFADGHGGWISDRISPVRIWDGIAHCYSPWFLDANHAPPGGGYLHLLLWIYTDQRWYQPGMPSAARIPYRCSSFADQGKSRDLRDATLTIRLRGEVDLTGTQLLLLAQSQTARTMANLVLIGRPIAITEEWNEQTLVLANDPAQWKCIGSRESLRHQYGCDETDVVLSDVNVDLIFVLFPIEVVAACPNAVDLHRLVAGVDYPVEPRCLPKGLVQFESIRIDYPSL